MKEQNKAVLQELKEAQGVVWSFLGFFRPTELKVFKYINDITQSNPTCNTSLKGISISAGLSVRETAFALDTLEKLAIITKEELPHVVSRKINYKNLVNLHKLLCNNVSGFGYALRNIIRKQDKTVNEITPVDIDKAHQLLKAWINKE